MPKTTPVFVGLDVHKETISVAYARLQAPRIAKARGTDLANIEKLIDQYSAGRALGFIGQPAVAVLPLNIALDKQYPYHKS